MIATTPVARWSWGEPGHATDLAHEAVRRLHAVLGVLERHRLGTAHEGRVNVTVPEMGRKRMLLRTDLLVGESNAGAADESSVAQLEARIKEGIAPGEIGGVELYTSCDGLVESGTGGTEKTEGLFALSIEVSEGYFNVALTTFSDAWMPFDLRGRAQEDVFAANQPRLVSAFAEISEKLDLEIDPGDPTWLGIPTESGVENHFEDDDGSPSDVWGRFEIPYRNGIFSQSPKFTAGYGRQASGPVRYAPVLGPNSVLGYLWASDAEGAASFEPREEADLDAYRAGLIWLDRLQQAYDRGLPPTGALAELGELPCTPVAGRADVTATTVDEFRTLAELAQQ
ncbi:hypothetical protein ACGFY6_09470 [Streptomyces sp. NPDC048387]|uniref:hypothetical protein n=1 Tax=Streptomyces sp. NPDC048387 TaxID=3365542 RepID=UPI00370FF984